jgi:uncharacterized protein
MSPRIKKNRIVNVPPAITGFNPTGCSFQKESPVEIRYEEYEAFKLADYNHLSHLEASERMGVSRPTFTRIYDNVRKKIARAFVEGLSIRITGGYVNFRQEWYRCEDCHSIFALEHDKGKRCCDCGSKNIISLNDMISEWQQLREHRKHTHVSVEYCICPSCKTRIRHIIGRPCRDSICPECGQRMTRE